MATTATSLWNTLLPGKNWKKTLSKFNFDALANTDVQASIPNIPASALETQLGIYLTKNKQASEGQTFLRSLGAAAMIPLMSYKKENRALGYGAAYRGYQVISNLNNNSIPVLRQLTNQLKMALIHLIAMVSSIPAGRLDITFYKLLCLIVRVICIALSPILMLLDTVQLIVKKIQNSLTSHLNERDN